MNEWAPSAARHGVSRARVEHVLDTTPLAFPVREEDGDPRSDLLLVVGDDPNGVPLEVMVRAVAEDTFLVFHAMRLRRKYRYLYDLTRGRHER